MKTCPLTKRGCDRQECTLWVPDSVLITQGECAILVIAKNIETIKDKQ